MSGNSDHVWDLTAIRRAIRLLGSHSPRVLEPKSTARALQLVWDILQRRGIQTEIFQVPGTMPMLVAGTGPILLITHLDDPHPLAQSATFGPPAMDGDVVIAPGITRKAAVLSAIGAVLGNDSIAELVTLVVETDRHEGSRAFAHWFDSVDWNFDAAVYEVADLPIPAPALYVAASGLVAMRITISDDENPIERVYGGVRTDVGHQLASLIAATKSPDGEVLIPDFYEGVITPKDEELAALQQVASSVGAWVNRGTPPSENGLSPLHLTLGSFITPSITVRNVQIDGNGPYLANRASAIVEARIMPGQDAAAIQRAISRFALDAIPTANVETLLIRAAAKSSSFDANELDRIATVIPIAAGNSPAGLLDTVLIPTLGFSTVWRDPAIKDERVTLSSIAEHDQIIQNIVRFVAASRSNTVPQ